MNKLDRAIKALGIFAAILCFVMANSRFEWQAGMSAPPWLGGGYWTSPLSGFPFSQLKPALHPYQLSFPIDFFLKNNALAAILAVSILFFSFTRIGVNFLFFLCVGSLFGAIAYVSLRFFPWYLADTGRKVQPFGFMVLCIFAVTCLEIALFQIVNFFRDPRIRKAGTVVTTVLAIFALSYLGFFLGKDLSDERIMMLDAAWRGDAARVGELLASNPELANVRDFGGITPLHIAALHCDKEIAELLIRNGADVNAVRNNAPLTPLLWAGRNVSGEIVRMLLDKGADVNATAGDTGTALHQAARCGTRDVAELLISRGAEVNAKNAAGFTPLHKAARAGSIGIVELLIQKGANVGVRAVDGSTPLHWASSPAVAKLLLDHDADVNAKGADGETPLHYAVRLRRIAVVDFLLDNGADINAAADVPGTPLVVAASYGIEPIVKQLVARGADINASGKRSFNPLEAAIDGRHTNVATFLRQHGATNTLEEADEIESQ